MRVKEFSTPEDADLAFVLWGRPSPIRGLQPGPDCKKHEIHGRQRINGTTKTHNPLTVSQGTQDLKACMVQVRNGKRNVKPKYLSTKIPKA
eukprot:1347535-Amorphochlora_amoeboformis.AAC.1